MKTKIKFIKNRFIGIFGIILGVGLTSIGFHGCEMEDPKDISDQIKNEVNNLSAKYNIPIKVSNDYGQGTFNNATLDDLEAILINMQINEKKVVKKKIKIKNNEELTNRVFETKPYIALQRLKTYPPESAIWTESEWFFNLTWLNSSIAYQSDSESITISSSFSGASLWEYTQDNSTYSTNGDILTYQFTGTASINLTICNFGFHLNGTIEAHGWVNMETGEGELTIATSGYW